MLFKFNLYIKYFGGFSGGGRGKDESGIISAKMPLQYNNILQYYRK